MSFFWAEKNLIKSFEDDEKVLKKIFNLMEIREGENC
jgi:hypothetical protein